MQKNAKNRTKSDLFQRANFTVNQHKTRTHEPLFQLVGIPRGYNWVNLVLRWYIIVGVLNWSSGTSISQIGNGQLEKN